MLGVFRGDPTAQDDRCLEGCTNAVASPFGVTGDLQAYVCRKLYREQDQAVFATG